MAHGLSSMHCSLRNQDKRAFSVPPQAGMASPGNGLVSIVLVGTIPVGL